MKAIEILDGPGRISRAYSGGTSVGRIKSMKIKYSGRRKADSHYPYMVDGRFVWNLPYRLMRVFADRGRRRFYTPLEDRPARRETIKQALKGLNYA